MEKKIGFREMVFVASMFFGMLFGAGNLIFPVSMGQKAGMETLLASLGFCITGVGLPLLSVVAMAVSKTSSMTDMARLVGKRFSYFFTTLLYLCIGPLFAIPRTAVVPFQVGIVPYLPKNAHKMMLFLFSLLFFGIVLALSLKPGKLLTYVGKVLNPIFLLFLSVLLFTALIFPMGKMTAFPATAGYEGGSLLKGLFEGYNTMDVVGALAFGNILIQTIRTLQGENAVGEENLATERIPFVTMLSVFSVQENGGDVLHSVSTYYFKSYGGILLAVIIFFSCLKTAVGLITSTAMAFVEMFPKSLSYKAYVCLFTFFSFAISNVGLSKIISYSVPALFFIYPMSMVLIVLCLFGRFYDFNGKVFRYCIYFTLPFAFLDSLKILLKGGLKDFAFSHSLLSLFGHIPLFNKGLTWLIPSFLGFALGIFLWYTDKVREKSGTV